MKKVLLALSGLFIFFQSFSQLSLDPNEVFAKCPNEFIVYTITNAVNAVCTYEWTVTNGEILGGFQNGNTSTFTGGSQVQIKWLNTTSSGSIQVNATNCNPSSGNSSKTWTIPILSINGVNPSAVTGAPTINVNVTSNQVYSIDQINFPNIGSGDVSPKQVNGYEWEIPTGWTVVSGGNTKSITVKPDNCSGGNIRVRGKNTACTGNTFYSNWSTVKTVTRTIPATGTITSSTGTFTVLCGDQTPITYSIPSVTGATSYTWTYPSGWTVQGSSTTNTITIIPSGLNAGALTARANADNCSLQSTVSTKSITLQQFSTSNPPNITGPFQFCTTANYALNNLPIGGTVNWSVYPPYTATISATGNTATVTQTGGPSPLAVRATVYSICGDSMAIQYDAYVGNQPPTVTINGSPASFPSIVDMCTNENNRVKAGAPVSNVTGWDWDSVWGGNYTMTGNGNWRDISSSQPTTDLLEIRYNTTACGWSAPAHVYVSIIDCFSLSSLITVYPNPASYELAIQLSDSLSLNKTMFDEVYQIDLINKQSIATIYSIQTKEKNVTIPLDKYPEGIYYLNIYYKGAVTRRQIIIKR